MSKIEDYQQAKSIAKAVRSAAESSTGLDSLRNDSFRIECVFTGLAQSPWTPAVLHFHASHGYYGSSSGYSDMSEVVGRYVAKAITELGGPIMFKAAQLAEQDAEQARKAAEDEAREVLAQTGGAS